MLLALALGSVAYTLPGTRSAITTARCITVATAPVAAERVFVMPDADAVAQDVCAQVEAAAEAAIAARGHFALAIPGGSILKMLEGAIAPAWASRTTLVYVNHK